MKTVIIVLVIIVIAGVLLYFGRSNGGNSATSSPTPTASSVQGNSVTISDMAFSPATLSVKVGTTVTWTNQDSVAHTVTADDVLAGGPASSDLAKGASYQFTFNTVGNFAYHCQIHPSMTGIVRVTQ